MSRLMRKLRAKKQDDVVQPKATEKKPKVFSDNIFTTKLSIFVSNKEAINKLEAANAAARDELIPYIMSNGKKDDKGNRLMRAAGIDIRLQVTVPLTINLAGVKTFLQKLVKKKHIKRSQANKILIKEYVAKLTQDQYNELAETLDHNAVLVELVERVDETQLKMLPAHGICTVDELKDACYEEGNEKYTLVTKKMKEETNSE